MPLGVEVAALGARTPVGLSAETSAAAVRAGISRLGPWPYLLRGGEPLIGGRDPRLDPSAPLLERLITMAHAAVTEIVGKIKRGARSIGNTQVLLCLPEERPGFSGRDAAHALSDLSQRTRRLGVPLDWKLSARGHAGGILALQRASELISQKKAELCLVGGVESYLQSETLSALLADGQLVAPGVRDGFPPGEAAGFVLLASRAALRSLRMSSLGRIHGAHVSQELKLSQRNEVCRADGLTEAVTRACAGLNLPVEAPGMAFCDINGQRFRSEEWGLMQLRVGHDLRTTSYTSAVSNWGDVGAASAPLLLTLACRSWARAYSEDPRALIWCASPSGARGALVIEAPTINSGR